MLIKYLNHTLLTTISCGLYQYKFPSRFAEEISFFSKLSEEFSALFNFSLDELQPIKKLYYSTLEKQMPDPDRYVTAAINHSLGDVYMQEENFSVAIRHYEKCVELVSVFLKTTIRGTSNSRTTCCSTTERCSNSVWHTRSGIPTTLPTPSTMI